MTASATASWPDLPQSLSTIPASAMSSVWTLYHQASVVVITAAVMMLSVVVLVVLMTSEVLIVVVCMIRVVIGVVVMMMINDHSRRPAAAASLPLFLLPWSTQPTSSDKILLSTQYPHIFLRGWITSNICVASGRSSDSRVARQDLGVTY